MSASGAKRTLLASAKSSPTLVRGSSTPTLGHDGRSEDVQRCSGEHSYQRSLANWPEKRVGCAWQHWPKRSVVIPQGIFFRTRTSGMPQISEGGTRKTLGFRPPSAYIHLCGSGNFAPCRRSAPFQTAPEGSTIPTHWGAGGLRKSPCTVTAARLSTVASRIIAPCFSLPTI
jgi:hypothetical protein